ncbi:RNaseH domain-containing protein [Deinococcus aestuarii]|uniref:RNaseH domain-containing protein n=1 Tax=Deinococcus aestuarii TaxID=2774531 RepID=UPI001C0C4EB8|nr:RNaseH domain-containing protein [Deinococcus aestuarii]
MTRPGTLAPARKATRRPPPVFALRERDPEPTLPPELKERLLELAGRLTEGLPMVFELGETRAVPVEPHVALALQLDEGFGRLLSTVEQQRQARLGKEPGRLPTTMLRLLLELQDPGTLRTEVNLWRLTRAPVRSPLLVTTTPAPEALTRARAALATWLLKMPDLDEATRLSVAERLPTAVRAQEVRFDPRHWQGGPWGHRDLADMAARALEGAELFPGRGGLRRIVSREMGGGVVELMTDPYRAGTTRGELPTSYVVRLKTKTHLGNSEPLLVMELSRRQWTDNASTFHGKVTLYALPARTAADPNPSVVTLRVEYRQHLSGEAGLDYQALRQRFPSLPEVPLQEGRLHPELLAHPACQVLAVARQGRGARGGATGALEVDRLIAFAAASLPLATRGLRPWTGLRALHEEGARENGSPSEPFQQLFAEYQPTEAQVAAGKADAEIEKRREAARQWATRERGRIDQHYGHPYRLLLLHAPNQDPSAARAAGILERVLENRVVITRLAMPPHTSGPVDSLPGKGLPPAERAEERLAAWKKYLDHLEGTFDGVLLVVPRGEGDSANDPVNKRASKIALLRGLRVHAQYLRPIDPEASDEATDFIRRTIRAMQDLAWEPLGMLDPVEDDTGELAGEGDAIHAAVTALTVVTVNSTRSRRNAATTVPVALRLDLQTQQTQAQLLLPGGATGWLSLREATVRLLGGTRKMSPGEAADRLAVQTFFQTVLDETQARAQPGIPEVVFIDGDTVSGFWPGLYDKHLDVHELCFEPGDSSRRRMQRSWAALTLMRLRAQDKVGKVLRLGQQEIEVLGQRLPTPRWAESQSYLVARGGAAGELAGTTFLSFGSHTHQVTRGMSGHLEVVKVSGKGRRLLKPHVKGYATPEALEVSVIAPGSLSLEGAVHLVSKLRRRYAHYDGWTKLPAPLFFSHLVKDYVPDYELGDEEDEVTELGTD